MAKVFISYARSDLEYLQKLELALKPLQRLGYIEIWNDRKILAGEEWDSSIREAINDADLVLLLVSPNYLSSDYLYEVEMHNSLRLMDEGKNIVVPLIIRPCAWHSTPIGKLQVMPKNAKSLSESSSIDETMLEVVMEIEEVIKLIEEKKVKRSTTNTKEHIDKTKESIDHEPTEPSNKSTTDEDNQILNTLSYLTESIHKIMSRIEKLESSDNMKNEIERNHMTKKVEYQVGLSFAGENRVYVSKVADELLKLQISVFYDEYETTNLWGKDLYQHLSDVYRNKCQYCVIFISKDYAKKLWTKHELKNAQARAFEENSEYILPARFDDTELPGLPDTVGYVDCSKMEAENLAKLIYEKVLRGSVA